MQADGRAGDRSRKGRDAASQYANCPSSIVITEPVMASAASESNKVAIGPISREPLSRKLFHETASARVPEPFVVDLGGDVSRADHVDVDTNGGPFRKLPWL
jgi:hypothetical protein